MAGVRPRIAALALAMWPSFASAGGAGPSVQPPGEPESLKTKALEGGAAIMQKDAPTHALEVHLVGFHPLKSDPSRQFEAHHFCRQVNQELMQCALFDGDTRDANLTGVEYIISERLFETLPQEERQYWHPHNGEILSGQLVAPGIPEIVEKELMKGKMNSYGKTWHTWDVAQDSNGGDALPLGPAELAWSFNRLGEARVDLIKSRDERLNIDTEERRRDRQDLVPLARPQEGVDALKNAFPGTTIAIPGVVDKAAVR